MSHHFSGPDFSFPRGDARLDISDLFVFPKPGDVRKSIIVMDVHPSFSIVPEGLTTAEPFAPEALYELKVDTNGDFVAEIAYRVRFSTSPDGSMTAIMRRVEGHQAAGIGVSGELLVQGAPVSMGSKAEVTQAGDCQFFAGWRSDPFFIDVGVGPPLDHIKLTGKDLFIDKDVCSIVLELPNSALGGAAGVNIWHRSLVQTNGSDSPWIQADRGARASQAVFLPGEDRDAYLSGEPSHDERFLATFAHALQHTGGYTLEEARKAARTLLPDVLPYDHRLPVAYPKNGRTLTDDVSDVFLAVLTNGKTQESGLGPHTDLLAEFPYLGPPHDVTRKARRADG
jgi:hypothetical protein